MAKNKSPTDIITIHIMRHADKNKGHPHIIVEEMRDNYVSVGFTTKSKKGKGSSNYKLDRDPLGGNKQSYMRRQGTVDVKSNYYEKRRGVMTRKDYGQAKAYADRAKNKYYSKNKKW